MSAGTAAGYDLKSLAQKTHALLADSGFDLEGVAALVDGSDLTGLPSDIDAAAAELARDFRAQLPASAIESAR